MTNPLYSKRKSFRTSASTNGFIVSAIKTVGLFVCYMLPSSAQSQENQGIRISGSIQSDILVGQNDETTKAKKDEDLQTNTYLKLALQSQYVDAGMRLEYTEHPLPGFEKDFKGWGLPHFYVKGKVGKTELTAGTFYEQFGSGLILRTYEDRSLGIDNSLLGGRLVFSPVNGMTMKLLSGKQRRYWKWNPALVSGVDMECYLEEWIPALSSHSAHLSVGGSWVNKYEEVKEKVYADPFHIVNFPKFVNAWDLRMNFNHGRWNMLVEYAHKGEDPSFANGYIFHKGSTALLSASYSRKGLSILAQAKRSENMSFKSTSQAMKAAGLSSRINHLPAFSHDQTYSLATLYPYSTQMADGEWAYQAELGWHVKPRTKWGGRYGMDFLVSGSYIRPIKRIFKDGADRSTLSGTLDLAGTDGYTTSFFKWGDATYYQDLDIQLIKKLTKNFTMTFDYINRKYNQFIVEGHGGMVSSHIFVAEGKLKCAPKTTLRSELQYLHTRDDQGDWWYAMTELSLAPHWMISLSDMYNAGGTHIHYYQGLVTFSKKQHRLQIGYGRTRAGFNCAGGVCRYVPATRGFNLSYNYAFQRDTKI